MFEPGEDEHLLRYQEMAIPCFDAIQERAATLAGLLLNDILIAPRPDLQAPEWPKDVATILDIDAVLARLPRQQRYAHFRHHMERAHQLVREAWAIYGERLARVVGPKEALPPLRAGWREIMHASRCLPGCETIDFRNSCCALHASQRPLPR